MKKISIMAIILSSFLYSIVYENGEDGSINRWVATAGATVNNIIDSDTGSRVIKCNPNNANTYKYYKMENLANNSDKKIQWDIKANNPFIVYVNVSTLNGDKTFYYSTVNINYGVTDNMIHHGIGVDKTNGSWHTITRDLEAELHESEPNNNVTSINWFKIRANDTVLVDNIKGDSNGNSTTTPQNNGNCLVIEDAEDGSTSRWAAPDVNVTNEVDTQTGSNVIKLSSNTYKYSKIDNLNYPYKRIQWDIKTNNPFIVYVNVSTLNGDKTFYYSTVNIDYGVTGNMIHHRVGEDKRNGSWHTITRDLEAELHESEPNNHITTINWFKIRASGDTFIDNIEICNGSGNTTPIANAGDDKNTTAGTSITIVGSSTDDDGAIVSYKWTENGTELATTASFDYTSSVVGVHTLVLTVTDDEGKTASDSMNVTVNAVADTTKPVITLLGDETVNLTVGDTYIDAGATATDNVDGDISANIQTTSNVDTTVKGNYTVTYRVSDTAGNLADVVTRAVIVNPVCDESTAITRETLMEKIGNGEDVTHVNTCKITDMSHLFDGSLWFSPYPEAQRDTVRNFNQDISGWDTSSVTNMQWMFLSSKDFNQSLNSWNVSRVTNMRGMFAQAEKFNQPLNSWNVSSVTDMNGMFAGAIAFNQPLNNWNVSHVTNMSAMFNYTTAFDQPLNSWNVSSVTSMDMMFSSASFNQPLDNWDVSNVINMNLMFYNATYFNQNIHNWDISNVANHNYFAESSPLEDIHNPFK